MAANPRWNRFVTMIPTAHACNPRFANTEKGFVDGELATWFSVAFASLKNGIRPRLQETVSLKRALFSGEFVLYELKDSKWDPWRQADADSRGAQWIRDDAGRYRAAKKLFSWAFAERLPVFAW